MTDYTATPEQWADAEHYGNRRGNHVPLANYACILELRARIEALEVVHFKSPSLKEQALDELDRIPTHDNEGRTLGVDVSIIRRALEQLND